VGGGGGMGGGAAQLGNETAKAVEAAEVEDPMACRVMEEETGITMTYRAFRILRATEGRQDAPWLQLHGPAGPSLKKTIKFSYPDTPRDGGVSLVYRCGTRVLHGMAGRPLRTTNVYIFFWYTYPC
jgi:hypothetical protein